MIISYTTLLPTDNVQADAVNIGIAISPIPVRDNVIKLDVAPILTNVSNDFNNVDSVLKFYISFLIYDFYLWSM